MVNGISRSKARSAAMLGAAGLGAMVVALLAGQAASALGLGRAETSLTVALPPVTSDTIYASPLARGRPIVVIDAGHGGTDPGASGVLTSVAEKDLTLSLARDLRDALVQRGRVRVALTRDGDQALGLEQRAAVARRLNAAAFVSLHMDSAANPLARGASVYSLSDVASDHEAAALAASLNRGSAGAAREGSVGALLSDLVMRAQMTSSAGLAARLVAKASSRVELRPDPHRFAAFHVLRRADSPAVLFEAGYLSNESDEALLRSTEHRAELVLALADAIETDIAARARR